MQWMIYYFLGKQIFVVFTLYKVYLIYQKFVIAYDIYLWGIYGIRLITGIFIGMLDTLPVSPAKIMEEQEDEYVMINTTTSGEIEEVPIGPEYYTSEE
jgi:hypothetical protein